MHLEHGIECIIDGLVGTALAKRKSGDFRASYLEKERVLKRG